MDDNQKQCKVIRDDVLRAVERKLTSIYNTSSETEFEILVAECKANLEWMTSQLAKMLPKTEEK
jgi:hypothetical protein